MDSKTLGKFSNQLDSPLSFRRLAAVKALATPVTIDTLPTLARAIEHVDLNVAEIAWKALSQLRDPVALDMITRLAISAPGGRLANLCKKAGYRNSHDPVNCIYLLVTEQLDAYFGKYFDDFQYVRNAYETGDDSLRANIMRVVQSGDRRFQAFFRRGQQRHERGEQEILDEINSSLRLGDWQQLFELFLEVPMKYGYPLLEEFRKSGWEPPEAPAGADAPTRSRFDARRSLYRDALRLSAEKAVQPGNGARHNDTLAVEGVTLDADAAHNGTTLHSALDQSNPIEAIRIVATLAQRGNVDGATRQKILYSPHWPIRLAGRLTGLCPAFAFTDDPIYWVREGIPLTSSGTSSALELWPSRATPKDVQRMAELPPEAFEGKLGAVRAVLRLIITSGVKTAIIGQDHAMIHAQAAIVTEED